MEITYTVGQLAEAEQVDAETITRAIVKHRSHHGNCTIRNWGHEADARRRKRSYNIWRVPESEWQSIQKELAK